MRERGQERIRTSQRRVLHTVQGQEGAAAAAAAAAAAFDRRELLSIALEGAAVYSRELPSL
eukprot:COSAG02_NODE_2685_length_8241_cov_12.345984_3_plen_61_part_00